MKIISIRLDDNIYSKVEKFANTTGITLSTALRGLIVRGLRTIESQNGTLKEKILVIDLPKESFGNIEIHVIKKEE